MIVANRDHCGRCWTRHGGNDHLCPVHHTVSAGCCTTPCDPADWAYLEDADGRDPKIVLRADVPADAVPVESIRKKLPSFRRAA